ncbi:helix-turn-helix transcriptional regulator [Microbacterium hydrocarbonoxydans]|uniref:helix-turn-helix transcriptional regulator n=1 Tax=Microbacterium hydrocarbonoxydans TaxID=273678 RepID=UPI0007BAEA28|nr:WYL domain-containing protein [Microbacterium hydrocarbonoxydans]GAT74173.1 HTH type 11 transcriptional regulator [Microbacterium sp. HM58-2]
MLETSTRLLQLLSLLQSRRHWPGADLADRLGVTPRTVRNDVARLRELGYPIEAAPGVAGGYRLGRGADMPPLLLDDEEAVAVAVALRASAGGALTGIEETSVRALVKLEQMLPSRLRHRIDALRRFTVPVARTGPVVDAAVLTTLAALCRDHERLRFDYATHSGTVTRRSVEPYRLAHREGRWYLVAFDLDRDDWRTFRADRMTPKIPTGPRFTPRPLPPEGIATYVDRGVARAAWEYRARIRILASLETVKALLPPSAGDLTPVDDESCILDTGADDPGTLVRYLSMLDLDFEVVDAPEVAAELRRLIGRYERAL